MARKPDTPCAECGALLWRGTGSRPNPVCRPCRSKTRRYRVKKPDHPMGCAKAGPHSHVRYVPCSQCGLLLTRHGPAGTVNCSTCSRKLLRANWARKNHSRRTLGKYALSVFQLADRDGARCHICGKRVDMKMSGMAPKGPTVDHLIPVADGGTNDPANLALAHRDCNVRRGVGGITQLRLAI